VVELMSDASAAHIATVRNGLDAANTSLNWDSAEIIPTAEVPTYEDALRVARESIAPTRAALDALAARIEELEQESRATDWQDMASIWRRRAEVAEARIDTLETFVSDLAKHGTRFDTNPTVMVHNTPEWVASQEWWQNRATQMDVSVRNRARAALADGTKETT
jgi:hypothetical protein